MYGTQPSTDLVLCPIGGGIDLRALPTFVQRPFGSGRSQRAKGNAAQADGPIGTEIESGDDRQAAQGPASQVLSRGDRHQRDLLLRPAAAGATRITSRQTQRWNLTLSLLCNALCDSSGRAVHVGDDLRLEERFPHRRRPAAAGTGQVSRPQKAAV